MQNAIKNPFAYCMKNQILLIALFLFSFTAIAQTKPSFGIRAGLSAATIQGDAANSLNSLLDFADGAITTSSRNGVFGGAYASIPISELISVEPALYYTQKGYDLKGDYALKGAEFISANARARLTTHYIDMPVVLKANIKGLQLFAGPQISYLASADLHTTAGVLGFNLLNEKLDAMQQFNQWDAALTAGVGYQFVNGLNITAAYDHGLSRVDAGKNMNAYNRGVKVGVGFNF